MFVLGSVQMEKHNAGEYKYIFVLQICLKFYIGGKFT